MKSGISVCKLIYTAKKKSAGGEGMVEHSAKILVISLLVSWYFEPSQPQRILRFKMYSVVLPTALKPACSSAMIFSACGFNLFSMIFSMTLLGSVEADRSVVLAMLQVAFLKKCDD